MITAADRGKARLLYAGARLLMIVRWAVAAGVLLLGVASLGSDGGRGWRFLALGGVIAGVNLFLLVSPLLRRALTRQYSTLLALATSLTMFDVACLGALTAWTGGVHSPALFLFLPQGLCIAGLLRPLWPTLVLTGATLACAGAALIGGFPSSPRDWLLFGAWGVSLVATVLLGTLAARTMHEREVTRIRQIARIRAMSAQLRAQQAALMHDEKLVAIGHLAAGVAHEINNPLASIDSVLQLMQRNPERPRPDAVNTLREQVARILRIVRQLTSYAHPSRGIVDTVALDDVVRSAVDLMGFSKRSVRVTPSYGLPGPAGTVRLNPQAVQQIITNLLVNAMDAVADKQGAAVEVRTLREDDWCVVEVTDNGTGIAPEHLPRIFEPFYTTKPVGQGTGLGLSICARLVAEQSGRIDVSSVPGTGTTFRVRLPGAPLHRGSTQVRVDRHPGRASAPGSARPARWGGVAGESNDDTTHRPGLAAREGE